MERVCSLPDVEYAGAGDGMAYNIHHYPEATGIMIIKNFLIQMKRK